MLDAESIFLAKLEKLEEVVNEWDYHKVLFSSAELRIILIDNLFSEINKNYRLKIKFRAIPFIDLPPELSSTVTFHMCAGVPFGRKKGVDLSLDQFLRHKVANFNGQYITVRELIVGCANGLGGVHLDKNNHQTIRSIEESLMKLPFEHRPSLIDSVKGLIEITLTAMEPLKQEVMRVRQ